MAASALGPVADLACGRGRHALEVAEWGIPVLGVDRSVEFLAELKRRAGARALPVQPIRGDLEAEGFTPLRPGSCGAVLIFRFLHRPLAPHVEALLAPGGLLLYETFTRAGAGGEGGPNNPAFRLAEGELPGLFPGLRNVSYCEEPDRGVASLAAMKPA